MNKYRERLRTITKVQSDIDDTSKVVSELMDTARVTEADAKSYIELAEKIIKKDYVNHRVKYEYTEHTFNLDGKQMAQTVEEFKLRNLKAALALLGYSIHEVSGSALLTISGEKIFRKLYKDRKLPETGVPYGVIAAVDKMKAPEVDINGLSDVETKRAMQLINLLWGRGTLGEMIYTSRAEMQAMARVFDKVGVFFYYVPMEEKNIYSIELAPRNRQGLMASLRLYLAYVEAYVDVLGKVVEMDPEKREFLNSAAAEFGVSEQFLRNVIADMSSESICLIRSDGETGRLIID